MSKVNINVDDQSKKDEQIEKQVIKSIYQDYKKVILSIEKASNLKDVKQLSSLYYTINKFRKEFNSADFSFIRENLLSTPIQFSCLPNLENVVKDKLYVSFNFNMKNLQKIVSEIPEVTLFNILLLILHVIDNKLHDEAFNCLTSLIKTLNAYNNLNRLDTVNWIKAKAFYYYALEAERLGKSKYIINDLISAYRTACLEMNDETQVTLINCVLRYYLQTSNYEQAKNFLSKSKYTENINVEEDSRHLYYLGKINAINMNYSDSFSNLTNSLRKAPTGAKGFIATIEKLQMIVELLMGDIPNINTYIHLNKIKPYMQIFNAVKKGNLSDFKLILNHHKTIFFRDQTYNLMQRLRLIVIKIGLRKINLSYSRISIKDITQKLNLGSENETTLIIMKSIRDGVFLGRINAETGVVESEEITDVYSTFEPHKAFLRRIEFLNNINNEAKKGIKYLEQKDKSNKDKNLEDEDNGFSVGMMEL